ncbi:MAG: outer membrane protein assembly factor BamA [Rhodobacteraceae bacterium]|nr:outer membrane protein assembly factor BamA [Paracoccaceae bacterium]
MTRGAGAGFAARLEQAILRIAATIALWAVLLLPIPATAQDFSFDSFDISGNERIEDATILTYAGIRPGESYTAGQLNDAYQRIVASGFFETVEFEPRGGTLAIAVTERPLLSAVAIEGNRRLDDEELLALIQSRPRQIYSPAIAQADAAAITEAYEARGRLAATVRPTIIRRADNRVDLVFEVSEGAVTEVERVSFVGNEAFSDARLRRVLATKQAGLFRAVIGADTLITDRLEFDQQLLTDFYNARGYPDFRVVDVTSELSRERDATFVTIAVEEGPQYSFGEVGVATTIPGLNTEAFRDRIRIRPGTTWSPDPIDSTIRRMEQLTVEQGLDFIRIEPQLTRNERAQTIDVTFVLSRGPRVFIERIDIEGNQTTLDRVIRDEFRVAEGDPFNPREVAAATERLRSLGFFEDVQVNTREGSTPEQVIVEVDVVERPTGSFGFGGTFSTSGGLGLLINFRESNFLGRGQTLSFDFDTTSDAANTDLTFIEPYFLGRDLAFGINFFYNTTDNDNSDFSTQIVGIRPSFEFPLGPRSSMQVRYTLSSNEIFDVSDDSSPIIQSEEGTEVASAPGYTFVWDTRRLGLNEDTNFLVSFGQDFAGLGGDTTYIKSTARAVAQTTAFNDDLTLRTILEGGSLNMLDGDTSTVINRFFLTSRQLRGFEFRGIGPRDTGAENDDALGGNYYAVARFEADFPLGLPEEYGITGGVFFDVGSLWGLNDTAGATGPVDDDFSLRSSVGVSIFWNTPIGPLTFNFANVLQQESYDEDQLFDFTITTEF